MSRFQHFVAIDWSGAVGPRQPGIAVAVCGEGDEAPSLVLPDGGVWSRQAVLDWLLTDLPPNSLVGFDIGASFAFVDQDAYLSPLGSQPARCARAVGSGRGNLRRRSASRCHEFRRASGDKSLFPPSRGRRRLFRRRPRAAPHRRSRARRTRPQSLQQFQSGRRSSSGQIDAHRHPRASSPPGPLPDLALRRRSRQRLADRRDLYESRRARSRQAQGPDQGVDRRGTGPLPSPLRLRGRTCRSPATAITKPMRCSPPPGCAMPMAAHSSGRHASGCRTSHARKAGPSACFEDKRRTSLDAGRISTAVVQRFCKPKVGGSIPSSGTSFQRRSVTLRIRAHEALRLKA